MKSFLFTFLLVATLTSFSLGASAQRVLDPFPNGASQPQNTSAGTGCRNIQDFAGLVGCFTGMINMVIPVIIGLAVLLFVWGLIKYITAGGDDKATAEARKFMLFGIIALFVMVSVWGLVGLLVNTFFPGGVAIPQLK